MADTDKVARLHRLHEEVARLKREEENLKKALLEEGIAADGQVYFTGYDGMKHRAYYSDSEKVVVDLDQLRELMGEQVYEAVTKERELDPEQFRIAVQNELIPPAVAVQVARLSRWRSTIRFGEPYDRR
jgi:hypothetical protein